MGLPCFHLLVGACLVIVCSQWLSLCDAGDASLPGVSGDSEVTATDKRFRADLGKREVAGGDSESEADFRDGIQNEALNGDLDKRFQFRTDLGKRLRTDLGKRYNMDLGKRYNMDLGKRYNMDLGKRYNMDLGKRYNMDLGKRYNMDLGKRYNMDLGKRFNFDLGKRSPYNYYKLDLGKRAEDNEALDDSDDEKRAFRMDLGKRSGSQSGVFRYPEDKKAMFKADLGKRSADGAPFRRRRDVLDQSIESELFGKEDADKWDGQVALHPDPIQTIAAYPDGDEAYPDKRASFRADLGKRLYFKSDLGKRASSFRYDLGKRAYFKSDLGKRAAFNSDLGKRSLYDWKRIFRTDLGR